MLRDFPPEDCGLLTEKQNFLGTSQLLPLQMKASDVSRTDQAAFSLAGTTQDAPTVLAGKFLSATARQLATPSYKLLFSLVLSRNKGESQAPWHRAVILSTQEAEARALEIQGLPELLTWFKPNLVLKKYITVIECLPNLHEAPGSNPTQC